jgi:hypothetical protein
MQYFIIAVGSVPNKQQRTPRRNFRLYSYKQQS